MFSKFLLGKLHIDDDARAVLGRTPLDLIARHAVCDFGLISEEQLLKNAAALNLGDEICSEFIADPTDPTSGRIRITTSSGWGDTSVSWIKPQPKRKKK